MFEKLPSLRGFHPEWFTGGSAANYLPLIYDLVALTQPKTVVTLGYGDGQIHFGFCQAARETSPATRCIAVRQDPAEDEKDDEAWLRGLENGQEIYGKTSELISKSWASFAPTLVERGIDILFIDQIDSGADLAAVLSTCEPALSPEAVVLFHGFSLERPDAPGPMWEKWSAGRHAIRFSAGIGLGVALSGREAQSLDGPHDWLFRENGAADLADFYLLAAERMEAQQRFAAAAREVASLTARQVWLDSIVADRREAQRILEEQGRILAMLQPREEAWQRDRESLRRDRAKAQLVMDAQAEQLKHWTATAQAFEAERDKYKQQAKEQKEILKVARAACRKKGRCFQLPHEIAERKQRPFSERILREIKRVPRNLLGRKADAPENGAAPVGKVSPPNKPAAAPKVATDEERYAAWINEHEPDAAGLETQRRQNAEWKDAPKISLLLPVYNPPARFLEEMLASILAQNYANWELCLVDAGSSDPGTLAVLENPQFVSDARVKITRLATNLGIAENTNRALEMATGEFFTCVDHDDLLAPFALHEMARAISAYPNADVIYSDEDRCSAEGQRHSPFFKPEWSPELLCSFMYLGHLTAYRRSLATELGGYRKEFDLSQDYDFALRATDRPREIRHVPQVLYHWREHAGSGSAGGKPGARATNLAALADAMCRRNLPAEIIEYPAANRARLTVTSWPRVSIIVSTDSPARGQSCAFELPQKTDYPDLEIIIVTNSALAESLENAAPPGAALRVVRYDKPFNFSDKCNVGAAAATGERLIFFNDDVIPTEPGWIQELIEQLENPEVGAVAPKMIYESGKIQHAGLVTGVRGLVGTACHQWPENSSRYTNFAQSLRDVSALSAACLAIRRKGFFAVGQFDPVHTPIAHSDLDLCFKVREAGLRCVYTPFVTMTHLGHASIGALEEQERTATADKASVFLLQRWGEYTAHDPYFPENVRNWLYADSPTPICMWGENQRSASESAGDLLFVTHDLSWSGAPLILLHVAKWCRQHGFFVVLLSPENGPVREQFTEAGIPVIVDPLANTGHPSFAQLAREFDCVIASTIFGAPIISAAQAAGIPHLWWIHEGQVAEHYLKEDRAKRTALKLANMIIAPDTASAQIYQPFTDREVRILNYGIPDPRPSVEPAPRRAEGAPVRFLLLGTIEHRKGQRVFLKALRALPDEVRERAEFQIIGRPHDSAIASEIKEAAQKYGQLSYRESLTHEEALAAIQNSDVMISASWDETGPLILMEALALGKPIVSTTVGAVAEHLANEGGGVFFAPGDSAALAAAITRCVREPQLLQNLRGKSRLAYEKYFTFDRFAEAFSDLVREAAAVRGNEVAAIPAGP